MKEYCVMGRDVSRSPSPAMMNAAFARLGIEARYSALSVPEGTLPDEFARLKKAGYAGMNVTIPYKTAVLPLLDELDPVPLRVQAVNTVKLEKGRYTGYNTDPDGIVGPLRALGSSGEVQNALLLGAGGAARAFCEAMNRIACRDIVVAVRELRRADGFAWDMERAFPRLNISVLPISDLHHARHDLIFNASPIGFAGIPLPDSVRRVVAGSRVVFDAVYRPRETDLLKEAARSGCRVIHGSEMLLHQGMAAFKIWTGKEAPQGDMSAALNTAAMEGGAAA